MIKNGDINRVLERLLFSESILAEIIIPFLLKLLSYVLKFHVNVQEAFDANIGRDFDARILGVE